MTKNFRYRQNLTRVSEISENQTIPHTCWSWKSRKTSKDVLKSPWKLIQVSCFFRNMHVTTSYDYLYHFSAILYQTLLISMKKSKWRPPGVKRDKHTKHEISFLIWFVMFFYVHAVKQSGQLYKIFIF